MHLCVCASPVRAPLKVRMAPLRGWRQTTPRAELSALADRLTSEEESTIAYGMDYMDVVNGFSARHRTFNGAIAELCKIIGSGHDRREGQVTAYAKAHVPAVQIQEGLRPTRGLGSHLADCASSKAALSKPAGACAR